MRKTGLNFLLSAVAIFAATASEAAGADHYNLGPEDKIRVTISEWSSAIGEFKSRLDGAFTIGASGAVSLPLLGATVAEGLTPAELEQKIAKQYQTKLGLVEAPSSSVEVVEYRPFFIVGSVEHPGNYPFKPGMTVLHAVSTAGGIFRRTDISPLQVERDIDTTKGELKILSGARDELVARLARLSAELDDQDSIAFPDELANRRDIASVAQLLSHEELLLKERRASLQADIDAQRRLKQLLSEEIQSLQDLEVVQHDHQIVVEKELAEQRVLVAKGLSTAPRLYPLETRVAEVEAKRRQITADLLRAKQDLIRADEAVRILSAQRRAETLASIKDARLKLDEVDQKISTSQSIVRNAQSAMVESLGEAQTKFSIVRRERDQQIERPATEASLVDPGDIIRVTVQVGLRPAAQNEAAAQGHSAGVAFKAPEPTSGP